MSKAQCVLIFLGLFFGSVGIGLWGIIAYPPIFYREALLIIALASSPIWIFLAYRLRGFMAASHRYGFHYATNSAVWNTCFMAPLTAVFCIGLVLVVNGAWSSNTTQSTTATITDKWTYEHKGATHYKVRYTLAENPYPIHLGYAERDDVPWNLYPKLTPGISTITLRTRPGLFGMPWVESRTATP